MTAYRAEAAPPDLRSRAVLAASLGERCPTGEVWQRLIRGEWTITDAFADDLSCYLVLTESDAPGAGLGPMQREILERLLRGDGQKVLALELGLSCSTIATVAKQALAILGLSCVPSQVPLALIVVARLEGSCDDTSAGVSSFDRAGHYHHVVRTFRPDRNLSALLTPAEAQVLRARIEGHSHQKIAHLRQTSPRTIANQLASASRRLGVSGRLEIIERLSQHHLVRSAAS